MNLFRSISEHNKKRKLTSKVEKIGMLIRDIERLNSHGVKEKLNYYRKMDKPSIIVKFIDRIEWQIATFETISDSAYQLETFTKEDDVSKFIKPLRHAVIEGRSIIDGLIVNLNSQLSAINRIKLGDSTENIHNLLKQELAIYKKYQAEKNKLSHDLIIHIEEELSDRSGELYSGSSKFIQVRYITPLITLIMISLTFSFYDDEFQKRLLTPEYISYLVAIGLVSNKMYRSFRKIKRSLKKRVNKSK